MHALSNNLQLPVYSIEPDEVTGNRHFRVYNFDGTLPPSSDLLIPHRKDHYLIVFIRKGGARQWIDMSSYVLKDNTVYFAGPNNIIVKEDTRQLWSTGIAFSKEFLSLQENAALSKLPLLLNPKNRHELLLKDNDVVFVEDVISKINIEYTGKTEWQQRMLSAYLTLLLTYLSRLYDEQFAESIVPKERMLLKNFQIKVDEYYRDYREVNDYASLLNISAGHLSDVIKAQSGKPAIKHIHDRIVLEARRLLFHSTLSLKEIAFDLGFADPSYFNRFFKRETDVTPAEYRETIRKMYH